MLLISRRLIVTTVEIKDTGLKTAGNGLQMDVHQRLAQELQRVKQRHAMIPVVKVSKEICA